MTREQGFYEYEELKELTGNKGILQPLLNNRYSLTFETGKTVKGSSQKILEELIK